jgi:two-component system response regulator RegA
MIAEASAMTDGMKLLIVDDDDILRSRMKRAMQRRGFVVFEGDGYETAIEIAHQYRPDYAVLDLKMPGRNGTEILKDIMEILPNLKAIMLTGYGSIANAVEAVKLGAVNYMTKPADADQICRALGFDLPDTEIPEPELESFGTQSLAEAQWEHIQRVLADCNGNISQAARQLDIPRRTLQRKLKKLAP